MVLNYRAVLFTLGILVFFLGIALLLPMLVALLYGEPEWWTFGVTALGSLIVGTVAWIQRSRSQTELQIRDGFAIVAMAWVVLSLIGALPFVMGGVLESYTDAFFETMSAF
ncbi:MAG TPA: potassium transporter, partial [Bacteroidetes bacterium]|nr:potassium transporter [Bacteroidota bacterium]